MTRPMIGSLVRPLEPVPIGIRLISSPSRPRHARWTQFSGSQVVALVLAMDTHLGGLQLLLFTSDGRIGWFGPEPDRRVEVLA